MTLLGELYANGLGVPQDDKKAAEWYKLAAARGDRERDVRAGDVRAQRPRRPARPRRRAPNGSPPPPSSAIPIAAYDLALLYIEGQLFPQDFTRAAELLRQAADAGSPEAQYALGTFYKEGRGVPKDMTRGGEAVGGRRRSATIPTPRSNTPSRSITATA